MKIAAKIVSIMALMAWPLVSVAAPEDKDTVLVVEQVNGTEQEFDLYKKKPAIAFDGDEMMVTTEDGKYSFAISDVRRFRVDIIDGIEAVKENAIRIQQVGNDCYEVSGIKASEKVFLVAADGVAVKEGVASFNGNVVIDMAQQPSGVYILKIGKDKTIKILKK